MITDIHFLHLEEIVHSLLIFNFDAIQDIILVQPKSGSFLNGWNLEEKENGILFFKLKNNIWICPNCSINHFPETFISLKTELLQFFNKKNLDFNFGFPYLLSQ